MVRRTLADLIHGSTTQLIDSIQRCNISLLKHLDKFHKNLCRTSGIIDCPMMVLKGYFQCFCNRIQLKTVQLRHQHPCKCYGIDNRKFFFNALPFAVCFDKSHIKRCVVCDHHASFRKFQELRQDFFDCRSVEHHVVVDAGQLLDPIRDRHFRVDKGAEFIRDLTIYHFDGTDLDDLVCHRTETGCL